MSIYLAYLHRECPPAREGPVLCISSEFGALLGPGLELEGLDGLFEIEEMAMEVEKKTHDRYPHPDQCSDAQNS